MAIFDHELFCINLNKLNTLKPLASGSLIIGVPAYNEENYIGRCLESLVNQTYLDFVVFISDNGSTDCTGEIARDFCAKDSRFFYFRHEKNIGSAKNFEFIYNATRSEYLVWLGAHDFLDQFFIERIIRKMKSDSRIALGYSKVSWVNEQGEVYKTTNGGDFVKQDADGIWRYLKTVGHRWGECTAINGVFRRDQLHDLKFNSFRGADHIVLTRIQYHGYVYRDENPMYFRFQNLRRSQNYMEKLTGNNEVREKHLISPLWPLVIAQIKDYCSLPEPVFRKAILFPVLAFYLEKSYKPVFGYYYDLIKNLIRKMVFRRP